MVSPAPMPQRVLGSYSGRGSETVTPSDTVDLSYITRGLYVGTTGDISVEMVDTGTQIYLNVPVGMLSISVTRVNSTSTTAADIVAVW